MAKRSSYSGNAWHRALCTSFFEFPEQDEKGKTFVQFFACNCKGYNKYIHHGAPGLRDKAIEKWGNQFIAFRTLLKTVQ